MRRERAEGGPLCQVPAEKARSPRGAGWLSDPGTRRRAPSRAGTDARASHGQTTRHRRTDVAVVAGVGHVVDPDVASESLGQRAAVPRRLQDARHLVQQLSRRLRPHPVARVELPGRQRLGAQVPEMAQERRGPEPSDAAGFPGTAPERHRRRVVAARPEGNRLVKGHVRHQPGCRILAVLANFRPSISTVTT
jgi:hypothetical protein